MIASGSAVQMKGLGLSLSGEVMSDLEIINATISARQTAWRMFIGPGAAEIAAANVWLKDHPIPVTFSMEGAGQRVCHASADEAGR
jgi:hypothetical protein